MKRVSKQNWFETLNQSLESENLINYWPLGLNISYGETVSFVADGCLISVTRENDGRYERPVYYKV